jgi:tripartite-type tricarboxylate transporter receptor subunit TctC
MKTSLGKQIFIGMAVMSTALIGMCLPAHAQAPAWPSKPLKFVVSFEPRGGNDFIARLLAAQLTPALGQSIVVENRTGAGGNIGVEYVAKQAPDGYTTLITSAAYIINQNLYEHLPFDPIKDFDAVSLVVRSSWVLTVPANSPAKSVKELIALSKSRPKGLSYGSAGIGTTLHFASELIRASTNANFVHIPYRGSGPVVPALLSGEVDFAITGSAGVMGQIKSGKLRALAVMSSHRTAVLPNTPTVAEALGMPGVALDGWTGAVVPAGTPKDVIARLSREMSRAINDPVVVKEKLAPSAYDAVGSTPEEFQAVIHEDAEKYARIAKLAKIERR